MEKKAIILSLITDDIQFRLLPICEFLQLKYVSVVIVLYDWSMPRLDCSKIIKGFNERHYNVEVISSIKEGIDLQKRNSENSFFYLTKHSQINSKHLAIYYLYRRNIARNKLFLLSHLPDLKRALIDNIDTEAKTIVIWTVIRNSSFYFALRFFGYIAWIVFFLLTILYKVNKKSTKNILEKIKTILFIRMDHLGDIICSLPSLHAIRRTYPQSKITVLCGPWSKQVLEMNPHLYDELIIWDAPWSNKNKTFLSGRLLFHKLLSFITAIRAHHFDLVIQPRGEEMNVFFAAFSNGNQVVSGINTNHPLLQYMMNYIDSPVVYNDYKTYHISEWPKLCLKELGIQILDEDIKNCVHVNTLKLEIQNDINLWRTNGYTICCLMIGSGSSLRQWPTNRFIDLIRELYARRVYSILLGGPGEIPIRNTIVNNIGVPVLDMVDKLAFDELASVLNESEFVISLDTSIMHFASLLGKKVIALFGAGNIELAKPVFSNFQLIKKELGCSGCADKCVFKRESVYAPCMVGISVDDVLQCAEKYIYQ